MQPFGLLNLNKPPGITSRRVVDRVARLVRPSKVGHAGTLDPLASGVLVLALGQATRLIQYVQQMPKAYCATFLLGRSSTTEDIEGEITELPNPQPPTRELLERAVVELTGAIQQRPPAFSALKVAGRRAYDLARAGKTVELASRPVTIHRLEIVRYDYPELCLDVECGGGTYIRSLGRDLAERCNTAAVMSALVRTAVGRFTLADAVDPEAISSNTLSDNLLPPVLAVRSLMEEITVSAADGQRLGQGLPIRVPSLAGDEGAAIDSGGRLVAILTRRAADEFRAAKYLGHGD